jgi:hypothetical protein
VKKRHKQPNKWVTAFRLALGVLGQLLWAFFLFFCLLIAFPQLFCKVSNFCFYSLAAEIRFFSLASMPARVNSTEFAGKFRRDLQWNPWSIISSLGGRYFHIWQGAPSWHPLHSVLQGFFTNTYNKPYPIFTLWKTLKVCFFKTLRVFHSVNVFLKNQGFFTVGFSVGEKPLKNPYF